MRTSRCTFILMLCLSVYVAATVMDPQTSVASGKEQGGSPEPEGTSLTPEQIDAGQAVKPHPGRDAPLWDKGRAEGVEGVPVIRKMHDGVFRLGNITINKNGGFVLAKGEVNMQDGLVEYLACGPRGKLHESVLKLDVDPYYFQIALLLIGLEPGQKPLERQGASGTPQGDPVEIWVTWASEDKKMIKHRGEELVLNKATGKPMEETDWVFVGSQVIHGRFMAQVEHTIAATYHDPFAILDHPLPTGADDTIHFANSKLLPPKGTPVNFVVQSKRPPGTLPFPPRGPDPKGVQGDSGD